MCVTSVARRCSRASAQVLRQRIQLAAEVEDPYGVGALLLCAWPFAVGWVAGWLATALSAGGGQPLG